MTAGAAFRFPALGEFSSFRYHLHFAEELACLQDSIIEHLCSIIKTGRKADAALSPEPDLHLAILLPAVFGIVRGDR
jgi:hypothetical protein